MQHSQLFDRRVKKSTFIWAGSIGIGGRMIARVHNPAHLGEVVAGWIADLDRSITAFGQALGHFQNHAVPHSQRTRGRYCRYRFAPVRGLGHFARFLASNADSARSTAGPPASWRAASVGTAGGLIALCNPNRKPVHPGAIFGGMSCLPWE